MTEEKVRKTVAVRVRQGRRPEKMRGNKKDREREWTRISPWRLALTQNRRSNHQP